MRAPCHRTLIRGFIDPHAPDHSVRAAITVCEHCPIRKECARDALTAGTSLDGEYTRPAGAVVQAGIICRGDADTARTLARVAGVPAPPHYREQAPRFRIPDGCNHCGRPLHKWTRHPEEIPEGHVMHYAKGWCVKCRGAYRGARNATVTEQPPRGLRKEIDRKRHHPETAAARALTAAADGPLSEEQLAAIKDRMASQQRTIRELREQLKDQKQRARHYFHDAREQRRAIKALRQHVLRAAAAAGFDVTAQEAAELAGVSYGCVSHLGMDGTLTRFRPFPGVRYLYRSTEVAAYYGVNNPTASHRPAPTATTPPA